MCLHWEGACPSDRCFFPGSCHRFFSVCPDFVLVLTRTSTNKLLTNCQLSYIGKSSLVSSTCQTMQLTIHYMNNDPFSNQADFTALWRNVSRWVNSIQFIQKQMTEVPRVLYGTLQNKTITTQRIYNFRKEHIYKSTVSIAHIYLELHLYQYMREHISYEPYIRINLQYFKKFP